MGALRNKSGLERYVVSGDWLFTDDKPLKERTVGGTFRVTVLASSVVDAVKAAEELFREDIIVSTVDRVR